MFSDFLPVLEAAVQAFPLSVPEVDREAELEQFNEETLQRLILFVRYDDLIIEV
jgi:hypothetical protein